MVKIALYTIIPSILIAINTYAGDPAGVERKPLTGDDISERLRKAEAEHARKGRLLKYDEMHQLYRVTGKKGVQGPGGETDSADPGTSPGKKTVVVSEGAQGKSNKDNGKGTDGNPTPSKKKKSGGYNESTGQQSHPGASEKRQLIEPNKTNTKARKGKTRYIPPSWRVLKNTGTGDFKVDQVKKSGPRFGITIGTRIYGELRRPVSNAERNMCEIYLKRDAIGEYGTLKRGTIIFAKKQFNESTKLLEMRAVRGITPDKIEFRIDAYAMDMNEVAGLSGTITSDGKSAQRSLSKGGYAVGRSMAAVLNDGTPLAAGLEAATSNMLSETEKETDERLNKPRFVIRVDAQPVILMVEKTF